MRAAVLEQVARPLVLRDVPTPRPDAGQVLVRIHASGVCHTDLKIIDGLGEGLSADQIRCSTGLSKTDYDSARRRMRRILLREGLTCEPK